MRKIKEGQREKSIWGKKREKKKKEEKKRKEKEFGRNGPQGITLKINPTLHEMDQMTLASTFKGSHYQFITANTKEHAHDILQKSFR